MLPVEVLAALDNLPAEEALRRHVFGHQTAGQRVAALLIGGEHPSEPVTIGDMLFRWARTEPDALHEARIPDLTRVSDIVAATSRLPKRFSMLTDAGRAVAASSARTYLLYRLVAQIHDAQGCEAAIGWAGSDPTWILINGLSFVVQDPSAPPTPTPERLTLVAQDIFQGITNNPLVYQLVGVTSTWLSGFLPAFGVIPDMLLVGAQLSTYAVAAAQATSLLMRHDTGELVKLASFASVAGADHLGHWAGHAAGIALFGVAGSWMVILAPIAAGLAGRVMARNVARRARFKLFCNGEMAALHNAIGRHCTTARDVLEGNIQSSTVQTKRFVTMHQEANPKIKAIISDWLQRIEHIQSYRRLIASRLHRAISDPLTLDQRDNDPFAAAHEALLTCARLGIHPANVAAESKELVDACERLQKKMSLALI